MIQPVLPRRVAVSVPFKWQQSGAAYLLVGSLLYLIGTIGVTIACNVTLNDALAIVKPDSPEGATLWAKYLTDWTFWNHIRTIAAIAVATLFIFSIMKTP